MTPEDRYLYEFTGISASRTTREIANVLDDAATCVLVLCEQALAAHERLRTIDRTMLASRGSSDLTMRLATIPCIKERHGRISKIAIDSSAEAGGRFRT